MMVRRGFIMPLALILMALAMALIARVALRVNAEKAHMRSFALRTQAELLAQGALPIVEALLTGEHKKKAGDSEKKHAAVPPLLGLCLSMNRWQRFQFTAERDGFSGEIAVYITAEAGKIDLNRLYDFEKKEYRSAGNFDAKKFLVWISERLERITPDRSFSEIFDELVKQRKEPFSDVGELGAHRALAQFPRWPTQSKSAAAPEDQKQQPALYDLFTVASPQAFSLGIATESVAFLAGMKAPAARTKDDGEKLQLLAQSLEKPIDPSLWNTLLAPLTGKEYTNIPRELVTAAVGEIQHPTVSVVIESIVEDIRYACAVLVVPHHIESQPVRYQTARFYTIL
jgi:hypothetical protein